MDLRQLQAFVSIAELRNFTKAAERLYIAQPALGLKIRKLEEELGQQLFVRHSRGVVLTEAGQFLLPDAHALILEAMRLKQAVRDFSSPPRGRVAIGLPPNSMCELSASIAKRALDEFPEVSLNFVEGLSHTLEEWLDEGRLDIACVFNDPDEASRPGQDLHEEPFVFVGNSEAMGYKTEPIELVDALSHPLVVPAIPHRLRALLDHKARELGVELNIRFEVQSGSLMNALIAQKVGYSILPASVVRSWVERGELAIQPIADPGWTCMLRLVWSKNGNLSSAMRAIAMLISNIGWDEQLKQG